MRHLAGLVALLSCVVLLGSGGCTPPSTTKAKVDRPQTKFGPQASIQDTSQEVGTIDLGIPREFKFRVANTGDEPLHLTVANKSCYCADVKLPAEDIAPDKEGTVTLIWTPKPGSPPKVETITCELATNDPQKPSIRLEIKGTVDPLVRIYPEDKAWIDFDRVEQGKITVGEVKVFSTKLDDFKLNAKLSDGRGMKVTSTKQELDKDTRYGDAVPKSAYSVVVETTPELAPGYHRADLLLTIEAKDVPARTIRLPVYADVNNKLFQVMPAKVEFNKERVTDADDKTVIVQFFNPAQKRSLRVVKCEPGFLKCDKPKESDCNKGQWKFQVHLPGNNAEAVKFQPDRYFEGEIVVQASDSSVQVPIRVLWKPPELKKP
jgi:hypothetical protein